MSATGFFTLETRFLMPNNSSPQKKKKSITVQHAKEERTLNTAYALL